MNKKTLSIVIFIFSFSFLLVAQENLLFDFGDAATSSTTSGNWNNVTNAALNASLALITDQGGATGYTLTITDAFHIRANSSAITACTGEAAIFPLTAIKDNFYGHTPAFDNETTNPVGIFQISGLNPAKYYSFIIYAGRAGVTDNRETLYTITGETGTKTATLDASNNTSQVAKVSSVLPTAAGIITFRVEAGPNNTNSFKYFYIGGMQMTKSDTATKIDAVSESKTINAYYKDGNLQIDDFNGAVNVLSLTGKTIAEGNAISGNFRVDLKKGMYIVNTTKGNTKLIIK